MESKFSIHGLKCEACVEKVSQELKKIDQVTSVIVNLVDKTAQLISNRKIDLSEVRKSLISLPKYQVTKLGESVLNEEVSVIETYKPLILIFSFILLVSLSFQISIAEFNSHLLMNHLMGGFFIGLSFFKFLNLKNFAESFSSYDPIAQRFLRYGYIYPFVEVCLGGLFIANSYLKFAYTATIIVLGITTFGVWKSLQRKSNLQCACAGAGFNIPLSYVTVVENLLMISMAGFSLYY